MHSTRSPCSKVSLWILPLSSFAIGSGSHTGTCDRIACTAWAAKTLVSHCGDFRSTETLANRWCSSWGCNFWASPNCWAAALLVTALVPVSNSINNLSNLQIFKNSSSIHLYHSNFNEMYLPGSHDFRNSNQTILKSKKKKQWKKFLNFPPLKKVNITMQKTRDAAYNFPLFTNHRHICSINRPDLPNTSWNFYFWKNLANGQRSVPEGDVNDPHPESMVSVVVITITGIKCWN